VAHFATINTPWAASDTLCAAIGISCALLPHNSGKILCLPQTCSKYAAHLQHTLYIGNGIVMKMCKIVALLKIQLTIDYLTD
jgi:hypothetical protein